MNKWEYRRLKNPSISGLLVRFCLARDLSRRTFLRSFSKTLYLTWDHREYLPSSIRVIFQTLLSICCLHGLLKWLDESCSVFIWLISNDIIDEFLNLYRAAMSPESGLLFMLLITCSSNVPSAKIETESVDAILFCAAQRLDCRAKENLGYLMRLWSEVNRQHTQIDDKVLNCWSWVTDQNLPELATGSTYQYCWQIATLSTTVRTQMESAVIKCLFHLR